MIEQSTDMQARRLLAAIYPTRPERALVIIVKWCWKVNDVSGPFCWLGLRIDDLICWSWEHRARTGRHEVGYKARRYQMKGSDIKKYRL